jgi:hypothetical protein
MRNINWGLGGLLAVAGLAGACAGPAQTRVTAQPSHGHDIPLDAPVEFVTNRASGPRLNSLGGEIPNPSPSRPVDEAGINEPTPG